MAFDRDGLLCLQVLEGAGAVLVLHPVDVDAVVGELGVVDCLVAVQHDGRLMTATAAIGSRFAALRAPSAAVLVDGPAGDVFPGVGVADLCCRSRAK